MAATGRAQEGAGARAAGPHRPWGACEHPANPQSLAAPSLLGCTSGVKEKQGCQGGAWEDAGLGCGGAWDDAGPLPGPVGSLWHGQRMSRAHTSLWLPV